MKTDTQRKGEKWTILPMQQREKGKEQVRTQNKTMRKIS